MLSLITSVFNRNWRYTWFITGSKSKFCTFACTYQNLSSIAAKLLVGVTS